MDEAESARGGGDNDEIHRYGPHEIFNDSYLPQTWPYNDEQNVDFEQRGSLAGFGLDLSDTANYTGYQPYQTRTPMPMDLDILSAENYQEGPYDRETPRQQVSGGTQTFRGLFASAPEDSKPPSPPASMRTRRSSKKEALKSTSADDNATRQRGRPRLDNRDQTAAERRRTQIRLAQRAYRQRKETTISRLNRRVAFLEKSIEDMDKAFIDFNEKALAAGIENGAPALAGYLQLTAERISELAKDSKYDFVNDEEIDPNVRAQGLEVEEERDRNCRRTATRAHPASMLGYQTTFEEEPGDDDGEIAQQDPGPPAQLDQFHSSGLIRTEATQKYQNEVTDSAATIEDFNQPLQQYQIYQVGVPKTTDSTQGTMTYDPMMNSADSNSFGGNSLLELVSLPLPTSHSYKETSFARRLMRSTVEANIRLMTDPNPKPEDLERLCKFTWCFAKSSTMIQHMMKMAQRTSRDGLEYWEAPRLHLGGAGLHYPRGIIDGESTPPPWWANEVPMGPQRLPDPQTPVPDNMEIADIIRRVRVEGDWFDSSDVEQYLRRKGLYLDGQSSVVEITEPDDAAPEPNEAPVSSVTSPGASSSKESNGGPFSPPAVESNWPSDTLLQGTDFDWTEDMSHMPEIPDVNMNLAFDEADYSNLKDMYPSLDFSRYPETIPMVNNKAKKFLDVEKFLDSISQNSMCIGRTAGFRKAAIDSALALATTEQFWGATSEAS